MIPLSKYARPLQLLLMLLVLLCALNYIFPGIVTSPTQVFPSLGGDGVKNEFTYLYHVLYGKGLWFDGLNYPYGEHIVYTDGQPLLSVPLAWLHHHYAFGAGAAMAVMLWAIVLSYILGAIYLWKIFTLQQMNGWLAVAFSLLVLLLSPQLFRATGHFGLAYICVVPMELYWLLRYHATGGRKYALYFGLAITIFALLHLYMLPLSLLIAGGYMLHQAFSRSLGLREKRHRLLPLLISIALATILIQGFIFLTDPVKDRPAVPLGFAKASTVGQEVIASPYSPIWQGLEQMKVLSGLAEPGEGNTYIGLVAVVVWLGILIRSAYLLVRRRDTALKPLLPAPFVFLTFFALAVGMGVPFTWGLYSLGERLPLINQFRTLGRFSWVFYYLATIYAALVLGRWALSVWANRHRRWIAAIGVALSLLIWAVDVNGYIIHLRKNTRSWASNNDFMHSGHEVSWADVLQKKGLKAADFQSIIILPYLHIGTEKVWVGQEYQSGGWVMTLAAKAALQLHLPIMDVMMSRSSWSEAAAQIKTAAGPWCYKPVLASLKDARPVLLLFFNEEKLNPDLQYLAQSADSIGQASQLNVYALYPRRLIAREQAAADDMYRLSKRTTARDTCINANGASWYTQHAGDAGTKLGALVWNQKTAGESLLLSTLPLRLSQDSVLYQWSCWTLAPHSNYRTAEFSLRGYDSAGHQLFEKSAPASQAYDSEGDWYRASAYLPLPAACRELRIYMSGMPGGIASYATDELQLRPATALVISHDGKGRLLLNNHYYKGPNL